MNLHRICTNNTPLAVEPYLLEDKDGVEVIVAVAKLAWQVSAHGDARIAIPPRGPRMVSQRGDDDRFGAIDYPSDRVDVKPGTDIMLVGSAYPMQAGATKHVVTLRVGTESRMIEKSVRVFGARNFEATLTGVAPGKPEPLGITPLVYELAYGGTDLTADPPKVDWTNPVGRGVVRDKQTLIGRPAFVIEPVGGKAPAGFGPLDDGWSPRLELAGTYDDSWAKKRAPLRPADFDVKHNAAAHPDLWSETPLMGDEPVEVTGATPDGVFRFKLPRYAPKFSMMIDDLITPLETHLDTYLIDLLDPNRRIVELTWRAAARLPRKSERLQCINIEPNGVLSDDVYAKLNADIENFNASEDA